jgi:hypothetical protein
VSRSSTSVASSELTTKPYARDFANEPFDESRERRTDVAAVVPDVDTCEHDLRMPIGQVQRLVHERIRGT